MIKPGQVGIFGRPIHYSTSYLFSYPYVDFCELEEDPKIDNKIIWCNTPYGAGFINDGRCVPLLNEVAAENVCDFQGTHDELWDYTFDNYSYSVSGNTSLGSTDGTGWLWRNYYHYEMAGTVSGSIPWESCGWRGRQHRGSDWYLPYTPGTVSGTMTKYRILKKKEWERRHPGEPYPPGDCDVMGVYPRENSWARYGVNSSGLWIGDATRVDNTYFPGLRDSFMELRTYLKPKWGSLDAGYINCPSALLYGGSPYYWQPWTPEEAVVRIGVTCPTAGAKLAPLGGSWPLHYDEESYCDTRNSINLQVTMNFV
jgi:hypothetical protein